MKTIEAFERDIHLQLKFLENPRPQKPLSERAQEDAVFCGSGDSLAAAMAAEALSDYRARALDPLVVARNKKLIQAKTAYFVSVSGNTISTVRAAKTAKNSVAITRNQSSRLARACGDVIKLGYEDSGVLTCGSIGFVASLLACVSLVRRFGAKNARRLFLSAKKQSRITLRNKVYVLGNQHTYPIAMYAAAKMYESVGIDTHYERIEQFLHMGLFSARKGDTVLLFEESNRHTKKMKRHLKLLGITVHNPSIASKSKTDQILFYTFVSQLAALHNAKSRRLSDCHFVTSKKIRNASSDMIY